MNPNPSGTSPKKNSNGNNGEVPPAPTHVVPEESYRLSSPPPPDFNQLLFNPQYPNYAVYNPPGTWQADYYAKYAVYQQQQQQHRQQVMQAYQQYYAAAIQQQLQQMPSNPPQAPYYPYYPSTSTSPTKQTSTAAAIASSPWNLHAEKGKKTAQASAPPKPKSSSPNRPVHVTQEQKKGKSAQPAPWSSMAMKSTEAAKSDPSAPSAPKKKQQHQQQQPVIETSNPFLRAFIKSVLRENMESNEQRQYIRKRLMEYVKEKGVSHDWESEDTAQFLQRHLETFRAERASASPPPTAPAPAPTRRMETRLGRHVGATPVHAVGTYDEEEGKKRARQARFREQQQQHHASQMASQVTPQHLSRYIDVHRGVVEDFDATSVVGTCQNLEKPYLRLTAAPNPANVRPLPILHRSFDHLKSKWLQDRNYTFMCDQLKSVRQDLMVQRIQNEFTVEVYETHARIALEMNDFSEFNQCQTQLKLLYQKGLSGCRYEFLGYRILYSIYTKSRRDMKVLLKSLQPEDFENPFVKYALQVREACLRGNFVQFLALHHHPLNMSGCLVQQLLERERCKALHILTKSHVQLHLRVARDYLGFETPAETAQFINDILRKACEVSVPKPDIAPLLVSLDDDLAVMTCSKLRRLFEVYLIAYKRVDIKGQVH